jgi:(R,R)-butanediol dehydrogenase / meso-butanediol dehydrogenase / diacetyl reductase
VVVESTGASSVLPDAAECARRGGRIVLVRLATERIDVDPTRLALFERSLIGSLGYRRDLPRVMRMLDAGLLDPLGLIGGVVPLAEAPATMAALASGPDPRIKVLVSMNG